MADRYVAIQCAMENDEWDGTVRVGNMIVYTSYGHESETRAWEVCADYLHRTFWSPEE